MVLNAGLSAQLSGTTSLYVSGGYHVGLDGRSKAYDGRFGFKVQW